MKIRIKRKVNEISAVAGVQGHAMPQKRKKDNSEVLEEMFSSSTQTGGVKISIVSGEREHAGHVERSKHQGLRNVMEEDDDSTIVLGDEEPEEEQEAEQEEETEAQIVYPPIYEEMLNRGYKLFDILGKGQFGAVFSAEDLNTGGDYVVKVVGLGEGRMDTQAEEEAIKREMRNYATIAKAGEGDERIWKHFPEVYDTFETTIQGPDFTDKLGFIVMEKLVPLAPEESAFIPDINYAVAQRFRMDAADVQDYGISRDQSVKAKWFISNKLEDMRDAINTAVEYIIDPLDLGSSNRKIDDLAASIHPTSLKRYERIEATNPDLIKQLSEIERDFMYNNPGYDLTNYYYILDDELDEANHALLILLKIMNTFVKIGLESKEMKIAAKKKENEEDKNKFRKALADLPNRNLSPSDKAAYKKYLEDKINEKIDVNAQVSVEIKQATKKSIQAVATRFINGIRTSSAIPISFQRRNIEQSPEERERTRAAGRDLFQAIQLVHEKTGLIAKDIHNDNVMKREGGNDIVIVDLGLFKTGMESVNESKRYRIKILTKRKKSGIL